MSQQSTSGREESDTGTGAVDVNPTAAVSSARSSANSGPLSAKTPITSIIAGWRKPSTSLAPLPLPERTATEDISNESLRGKHDPYVCNDADEVVSINEVHTAATTTNVNYHCCCQEEEDEEVEEEEDEEHCSRTAITRFQLRQSNPESSVLMRSPSSADEKRRSKSKVATLSAASNEFSSKKNPQTNLAGVVTKLSPTSHTNLHLIYQSSQPFASPKLPQGQVSMLKNPPDTNCYCKFNELVAYSGAIGSSSLESRSHPQYGTTVSPSAHLLKKRKKPGIEDRNEAPVSLDIEREYEYFYGFSRKEIQDIDQVLDNWSGGTKSRKKKKKKSKGAMVHVSAFQCPHPHHHHHLTQLHPTSAHQQNNDEEKVMQSDGVDDNGESGGHEDHVPFGISSHNNNNNEDDAGFQLSDLQQPEDTEYARALELVSLAIQLPCRVEMGNAITPAFQVSEAEAYVDMLYIVVSEMSFIEDQRVERMSAGKDEKKVTISDPVENKRFYFSISPSFEYEANGGENTAKEAVRELRRPIQSVQSGEFGAPNLSLHPSSAGKMEHVSIAVAPGTTVASLQDNIMWTADNLRQAHSIPSAVGSQGPQASASAKLVHHHQHHVEANRISQSSAQICPPEVTSDSIPSGSVYSESLSNVPNTLEDSAAQSCFPDSPFPGTSVAGVALCGTSNTPVYHHHSSLEEDEKLMGSGSRRCAGRMEGVTAADLFVTTSSSGSRLRIEKERRQEQEPFLYAQSRMSRSNNKRKLCPLKPHQSKIDSGTMSAVNDSDVSSSESVKLEHIHVRPVRPQHFSCHHSQESVQKMLMLQAEILREPDKYNDPYRFDAFDLAQLDYAGMEKYLKSLRFYSLRRKQEEERGVKRKGKRVPNVQSSLETSLMIGADDIMDSTSRKEEGEDEEIRVRGLCVRIKNFFNLRKRLQQVSPGKFCWKEKKEGCVSRTGSTTSYDEGSTSIASTASSSYRRRKELQCEIEGRQVTDSDCSSTTTSYELSASEFSKSTAVFTSDGRTVGEGRRAISIDFFPLAHERKVEDEEETEEENKKEIRLGVGLFQGSSSGGFSGEVQIEERGRLVRPTNLSRSSSSLAPTDYPTPCTTCHFACNLARNELEKQAGYQAGHGGVKALGTKDEYDDKPFSKSHAAPKAEISERMLMGNGFLRKPFVLSSKAGTGR